MIVTDYFDLHCDTPYECFKRGIALDNTALAVNTVYETAFCRRKQCFAIWIKDDAANPYRLYRNILNDFKSKLCKKAKNVTAYLTVEGGAVLEDDAERLYGLKCDGIKALTLTWNGKNRIASGALERGGLTDFGRAVISIMNELSMVCDLAHINREGFFDAIEIADRPIVTHACCDAVHSHPRNLPDDALRLIAERGGVIGLCFYPVFLGSDDVLEAVYRHIYHMLDMGLEKSIAIGSDFDGADMAKELSDISKVPNLYRFLLRKGLSRATLGNIFYKNADNFFSNL